MKVAIVGSRGFKSRPLVYQYIDSLPRDTVIISGGARGVDTWAKDRAIIKGLAWIVFLPDLERLRYIEANNPNWSSRKCFGIVAYARNQKIARECDRMVAFWDGKSKGTLSSMNFAKHLGKDVEIISDK
mgnify:FL=1